MTRSVTNKQNNAPFIPATPPQTPLTKTSSCPSDLPPSLGMDADEGGCQDGDTGSMISEEQNVISTPLTPTTSKPKLRQQQRKIQESSVEVAVQISPELSRWIRLRAQDLIIRQSDRQWAVELVNNLRDNLLDFLKNNDEQPYFKSADWLTSGSYYEMVKIHNPNEFDMMVKLQSPSRLKWTELDQYHGLFYEVALSRPTRNSIRSFLLEDGLTISASKILSEMRRLIRKFISTYKVHGGQWRWVVNRKTPNCPAVTLSLLEGHEGKEEQLSVDVVPALEVPQSQCWPQPARGGLTVENWLGKKTRKALTSQTCYFVPKRPKGRNLNPAAKESWRISFSHIEKEIIKFHGNKKTCCESAATKCCRKPCFKLLKCLIEALKQHFPQELESLCSYHGKTAFLHTLSIRGQDTQWSRHHLPSCFLHLLGAFEGYARSGQLPHFFVPGYNLFSPPAFPSKALVFLTNTLEEQRRLGLPLFLPPAPAPLLPLEVSSDSPITPVQTLINPVPLKVHSLEHDRKIMTCMALLFALICAIYIKC